MAFLRNDAGLTPLHWAAQYSAAASVAPLVDAGADLEAHDKHGWTPLRWAIAAGADVAVVDEYGGTPPQALRQR